MQFWHLLPSWLAPGVGGAIAASLAMLLLVPLGGNQPRIEDEAVAGHIRSLQVAHLTDVRTSNQHLIKPWFNGKIDFSPPVPELADQGFPLIGGRLDSVDGKTVPAIVYKPKDIGPGEKLPAIVHVHGWVEGVAATDVNYPCGSEELAHSVSALIDAEEDPAHAVVGLRNHGITATGSTLEEILDRIEPHLLTQVPMT